MIIDRVLLKVKGSEYEIRRFNYEFQRDIDVKGRPCSVCYGGEITVQLESSANIWLFQQMIDENMPMVDGAIEMLSGNDEVCVRRIEFKESHIYSYKEYLQSTDRLPMTTTIGISPMRLDFNNNTLRIDRKWPRADGWQKHIEEKVKVAQKTAEQKAKIIEAYWIDKKNCKHYNLFIDHPVTLLVNFEDYEAHKTINLKFENDDKTHSFEYLGEVGQNGIMEITNFQLKQNKES